MTTTIGPGITLGLGVSIGVPSGFTINASDIVGSGTPIYQNTTVLGTDGRDGFQNTAAQTWLGEGYYAYNISSQLYTAISDYVTARGISTSSSDGYLYTVTWGPGSSIASGIAKLGFYNGGGNASNSFVDIQAVDPSYPSYLEPNNTTGHSLVGTFLFPATFTIYSPLINKSGWC
jgi:hypothetical protein